MLHRSHIYGVVAEFPTPHELIHAVEKTREAGYRRMGEALELGLFLPPR